MRFLPHATAIVLVGLVFLSGTGCSEGSRSNTLAVPDIDVRVELPSSWIAVERPLSDRSSTDPFIRSWRLAPNELASRVPYFGCTLSLVARLDSETPEHWLARYDTYPPDQLVAQRVDDFGGRARSVAIQVSEAMPMWYGSSIYVTAHEHLWRLQYTNSAEYDDEIWATAASNNAVGCRAVAEELLGSP